MKVKISGVWVDLKKENQIKQKQNELGFLRRKKKWKCYIYIYIYMVGVQIYFWGVCTNIPPHHKIFQAIHIQHIVISNYYMIATQNI